MPNRRMIIWWMVAGNIMARCGSDDPRSIVFDYQQTRKVEAESGKRLPNEDRAKNEEAAAQEGKRPARGCVPQPPNRILNGGFEIRPLLSCGWNSFDASDWGLAIVPYCYRPELDCAAYLEAKVWGDPWVAQFYQWVELETSSEYVLEFDARAAGDKRPLTIGIFGAGPLDGLGSGITIELETEWRRYRLPFTSTDWDGTSALIFAFGDASSGLYLDEVVIAPPLPPLADSPEPRE